MQPDRALNYSLTNNAVRELLCALLVCVLSSPPLIRHPLPPPSPLSPQIFLSTLSELLSHLLLSTCDFPGCVSYHWTSCSLFCFSPFIVSSAHLFSWATWPTLPMISFTLVSLHHYFIFPSFGPICSHHVLILKTVLGFPSVHISSSHSPLHFLSLFPTATKSFTDAFSKSSSLISLIPISLSLFLACPITILLYHAQAPPPPPPSPHYRVCVRVCQVSSRQ